MRTHLSLPARARFATWFCRHDLFESKARAVSVAVIAAVALCVAASCIALAVPSVTAEVRLRRLADTPWARCIWVYAHTDLDEKFTDARLRQLDAEARARLPAGAEVQASGFHDVTLGFYEREGGGVIPRRGRTVGPGDPLFPAVARLTRSAVGFDGPDASGVILSPTLLQRLGWSADDPPTEVRVQTPNSNRSRSWAVAGVTRDPLPLGHDFLLTEAEDERLRGEDADNPQKVVWSGPLAPGWPRQWSQFPDSVRNAAGSTGWKIEVEVQRRLTGWALKLTSDYPRPESEWKLYLARIHTLMQKARPGNAPEFVVVEADGPAAPPPQPRGPYPKATVYVSDLKHLRPAADAAREMDLYANDAARTLVDEIETTAANARAVVLGLVTAFCTAGAVTLILALYLRGRQKAAQIGMLRAMGSNDRVLRAVAVTEALVLWAAGALIGLGLAGLATVFGCLRYAVTAEELAAAAKPGWWAILVGAFIATSLVSCVAGNLIATRGVRRRPAAESLGLTS